MAEVIYGIESIRYAPITGMPTINEVLNERQALELINYQSLKDDTMRFQIINEDPLLVKRIYLHKYKNSQKVITAKLKNKYFSRPILMPCHVPKYWNNKQVKSLTDFIISCYNPII